MKTTLKKYLSENKGIFYAVSVILLTMSCIVGIYCHFQEDIQNACRTAGTENLYVADTGLKCRQCGKNLKHKGFFCGEDCRQHYSIKYHTERYGKEICRNCGKEFAKWKNCNYFCSEHCQARYFCDLKLVSEAEEFRNKEIKQGG